jgi:hypothetical protein
MLDVFHKLVLVTGAMFFAAGFSNLTAQSVQYPQDPPCVTIRVECPVEPKDSEPVDFIAIVGFEPEQVTYEWAVHGGTIVDGQGTPNVRIRRDEGASGLTATVSLKGGPANCPNTASCSFIFHRGRPKAYLFDFYKWTPDDEVRNIKRKASKRRRVVPINRHRIDY